MSHAEDRSPRPVGASPKDLGFGVRLTQAEYERRTVLLYQGAPPIPTDEQVEKRTKFELNLMVDYRLGQDFPAERREQLWQVKKKLDGRRLWLLAWGALTRPSDPGGGMMRSYARGFASVLEPQELKAFLDLSDEDAKKLL